jgi:S1-C subfamily serine protease
MKISLKRIGILLIIPIIILSSFLFSYHSITLKILENVQIEKQKIEQINIETKLTILQKEQTKLEETVQINRINNELRVRNIYNEIEIIKQKPIYTYLKNITVYMHGEIPEKIKEDGTIRVKQGWVGTGSILKIENGYTYILTNNHVTGFKEPDFSEVILTVEENKYTYYADQVINNPKYDAAIVRIKGVIPEKQAIKGFSENYKQQDKVYSVGNYLAIPYLYSEGTIAGYNKDKDENFLLVNLNVAGGCSGSAVVDKDGKLVSVLFATYYVSMFSTDTARALTVPYLEIKDWLKENLK